MLRLVLLGSTGYTGSAVLRAALAAEVPVHALLRRRGERLPGAVTVAHGALPELPAALFPDAPCVVVHLASKQIDADGSGYWAANVGGADALMAALPPQVRGVIYGSSMSVYGQGAQRGVSEVAALRPATALAKSRAGAEDSIRRGAAARGVGGWLLRPRFVVGQGDRHTAPGLIKLAQRGLLPGGGAQRLSLVDVDDYAALILHLAGELQAGRGPVRVEALNIGYAHAPTLSELLEEARQTLGLRGSVRRLPLWAPALAGLRRLPAARDLATKLELIGLDHYGDTDRLARVAPQGWMQRDPVAVFRRAVETTMHSGDQAA